MEFIASKIKKVNVTHTFLDLKNLLLKVFLIAICFVLLIYSETFQQSIKYGIHLCINMLVPSLFPFMIIASFTANSGIFEKPNKLLAKITEKLFYLPGYAYPAIILSFIGGYPVGSKCVKALYENKKINDEQLNRMMYFCVNSGPAFTVGMLGGALLDNKTIGIVIFLVQIISGILIGASCGAKSRMSKKEFYFSNSTLNNKKNTVHEAFIDSVTSGCESTIQMCAVVIIFMAVIGALENFKAFDFINLKLLPFIPRSTSKPILASFLEVTYGCICAAKNSVPYPIIAFGIGYGGICTHLQISAILKKTNFKYLKFCTFRLINAILSFLALFAISRFFPVAFPAFSTIAKAKPTIKSSSTPIGSIALIILCFYFLADLKLNKKLE